MNRPVSIMPATCDTCWPWVRWWRTGSGAWVRQEQHEAHCTVYPKVQRSNHYNN